MSHLSLVCNYCGAYAAEGTALKVCASCRNAHYCGRECQRLHWKDGGHRDQCYATRLSPTTVKFGNIHCNVPGAGAAAGGEDKGEDEDLDMVKVFNEIALEDYNKTADAFARFTRADRKIDDEDVRLDMRR